MKSLHIKNARAVLPTGVTALVSILIKNGKIAKIGEVAEKCDKEIDACGGYLLPGFIDIHVHGGGGADFMDGTSKAFETAIKSHLEHGTTTIVPTALTATKEELIGFINAYHEFKATSEYSDLAAGLHLEGPYFSSANAKSKGAQKGNLIRDIDFDEIDELLNLANGDIIRWDAAPEIENSNLFAKRMVENNITCAVAHTDATAEQATKAFENGFSHVTHFYNAVSAHRKREQKVYAGVVEATYINDDVTIELIGDGCHIAKEDFLLAMKIKGCENISVITDAMRIAGTNMTSGKLGSVKSGSNVIVDDGVAKLPDLTSFAGSIATMDRCLRVLCKDFGFGMTDAAVMLSLAPAKLLSIDSVKGSIEIGKDADLVITDEDLSVKTVLVNGDEKYVRN
ncbi:MAG: N-acetylglucosamine-6-phosphate deacetylase [Ruminococcaceae bacterium]|nr:N-acetylglucosamine-6-phosphate deacetylase [Oscillospiraceae bacterium]